MRPALVSTVVLGFAMVTVSTLAAPIATELGANDLATVSAASGLAVSEAFAAAVLEPAFAVVSAPTPIELL